jgi:hypothetical protein
VKELDSVGTISEIIAAIKESGFNSSPDTWFRGHSKYEFKLLPSVFRDNNTLFIDEAKQYNEFIRRFPNHSQTHRTPIEWLTLMQHYGLPTRLLDWTSNLLIGLFFACDDLESDGALFVFNSNSFRMFEITPFLEFQITLQKHCDLYNGILKIVENDGKKYFINHTSIEDIKNDIFIGVKFTQSFSKTNFESFMQENQLSNVRNYVDNSKIDSISQELIRHFSIIVPIRPPLLNDRLKIQQSFFTFHGGKIIEDGVLIKFESLDEQDNLANDLIKIKISKDIKQSLLGELALAGISKATLFPEMEYQAEDIKNRFTSLRAEMQSNDNPI